MSEIPKHLTDPDEWFVPEMPNNNAIWVEEAGLRELWEDIIYNPVVELKKELTKKLS